jgi:hypothetical protein
MFDGNDIGWQSIESAPRDGSNVLLAFEGLRGPVIGHWVDQQDVEYGQVKRSRQYWSTGHFKIDLSAPDPVPTHWMPLPKLPNQ